MSDTHVRIRVGFAQREFEIDAPDDLALEWYERLQPYIGGFATAQSAVGGTNTGKGTASRQDPSPQISETVGENDRSFGEFYQRFRNDVTDVDRMLIAGYFIEESSASRTFSTAGANNVLRDQGVRVTNPSESLRRNLALRRVFKQTGRDFRLSRPAGVDYLRSLLTEGAILD